MQDKDFRALAESLLPVVLRAGAIELAHFHSALDVETKPDASPVTAADREAEAVIEQALAEICPDIPVIGEEAASEGRLPAAAETFFLVDPLDGTRDFVAGRTEFTVNIALVVDHVPVFGIVYQPPTGRLFMTLAGDHAIEARVAPDSGACTLADLSLATLRTNVTDAADLRAAVSRSHRSPTLEAKLTKLGITRRVEAGSSLKFCFVACGDADVYPRLTSINEWDTAAGHALVTAAGGTVLGLDGRPLAYGNAAKGYRVAPFVAWATPELAASYTFD